MDPNERYKQYGYHNDLLPKTETQRTWNMLNYFTLWQGSVHNIPNYAMVGGFLVMGVCTTSTIMLAIALSGFVIAGLLVLNGMSGSKYGVPFRCYCGAIFPGFMRGCVVAIMWFGLQNFAGSLALLIIIGKLWPGFLQIGEGISFMGLSIPVYISFFLFWG